MPSNHDLEDPAALALLCMKLCEKRLVDAMDNGVLSAGFPEPERLDSPIEKLIMARTKLGQAEGYLDTLIDNLVNWRDAIKTHKRK